MARSLFDRHEPSGTPSPERVTELSGPAGAIPAEFVQPPVERRLIVRGEGRTRGGQRVDGDIEIADPGEPSPRPMPVDPRARGGLTKPVGGDALGPREATARGAKVVDALDEAFYKAFKSVEPTGKSLMKDGLKYIGTALAALAIGRKPRLSASPVCTECKRRGTTCLTVAEGVACLGPVTRAGCGALCPAHHRGCFGCFGPAEQPATPTLIPLLRRDAMSDNDIDRVFATFTVAAPWDRS